MASPLDRGGDQEVLADVREESAAVASEWVEGKELGEEEEEEEE